MTQKGYGESNGKIILVGEHAVTFGQPAIAIPFSSGKVTVEIEEMPELAVSTMISDVYEGEVADAPEHLHALISRFEEENHIDSPVMIKIDAQLPPSRGLGSSAAVAVAFTRAAFDYMGKPLSDEALIEHVNWAEMIAHGKPSGIDAQTIVSNKPTWFQEGVFTPLKTLNVAGYMVVLDTGIRGNTKEAVSDVHELVQHNHENMQFIERIGRLVHAANQAINTHNFEALADIFNECQSYLATLTVSHPKIDRLLQVAKQAGAVAGKLTGSGRGGSVITLVKDYATAKKVAQAVKEAGAKHTWIENLGG
ncbi:mevalonate kinase [Staphylococcus simulans]|uniref:mevalonate kinase n=1 Tax=Staphylococcus simulans TaxID=1286 RepID=UPI003F7E787C